MEQFIVEAFSKYDLYYDPVTKTMIINTKILVRDFLKIKKIIKEYELNVKELIVKGM